jgi:hypothetical protein
VTPRKEGAPVNKCHDPRFPIKTGVVLPHGLATPAAGKNLSPQIERVFAFRKEELTQTNFMKKIAIIASPGFIPERGLSTKEKIDLVGQNTGNLVFHYAAKKILKGKKYYAWPSFDGYDSVKKADLAIFIAANHLRIGSLSEEFMGYLESIEQPAVVLGLGIQSPLGMSSEEIWADLAPDPVQSRFFRWLGSLSGPIGVRGEVSAQVLALAGVESRVIGCPSLFLNRSKNLGQKISQSLAKAIEKARVPYIGDSNTEAQRHKVAVAAAATWEVYNSRDAQLSETERRLFRLSLESGGVYIQQSGGSDLIDITLGRFSGVSDSAVTSVAQILGWTSDDEMFRTIFPRLGRVYFDVVPWLRTVATHDLSIGTRMHGNMLGIAAGIPAIFVPHDGRTQELVEAMKLPWVRQQDLSENSTLSNILAAVQFDGNEFDKRRAELAINLEDCLSHNSRFRRSKLNRKLLND